MEKSQKEGINVAGRKEKVLQGSHTVSLQGNDRQVEVAVSREDMVYPLSGNSARNSEVPPVSGGGAPSSKTLRGVT